MSRGVKCLFFKIFPGGLDLPFDPGRKSVIFLKISVETGFYGIFRMLKIGFAGAQNSTFHVIRCFVLFFTKHQGHCEASLKESERASLCIY
jgi:hypothetical protein